MSTNLNFENILQRSESSILDFKEDFYDLSNENNTAKFVKDIISFCNTIRTESAFIILGVREKQDGNPELKGITAIIDDAILQNKIKDKAHPKPVFSFSTVNYNNLLFGVIEIPIIKYELPIMPVIKMKGLETGKVYYRSGSSNTEASGLEIIRINDWLKSLSGFSTNNTSEETSNFLKRLAQNDEKLSIIIADLLVFSKKNQLQDLENLCNSEIKGAWPTGVNENKYRIQNIIVSQNTVTINPYSMIKATADTVRKEMEEHDEFHDYKMFFNYSITKIEEMLFKFNEMPNTSYATLKMPAKKFIDTDIDSDINVYVFGDNLANLYSNIRQKLIDEIMKI